MIGTVKVITVTFLEDDIFEGTLPREAYENAREEEFEVDDIEEAVRVITSRGLTFSATGSDWAGNPDGTTIVDYATAEREDVSAHLNGFRPLDVEAIIARVG